MAESKVYPQEVWDHEYSTEKLEKVSAQDQCWRWMEGHLSGHAPGRVLEIGCFPGRYLAAFGEKGWELSGIDLTPRVAPEMKDWLKGRNYRIGRIERGDFASFSDAQGFDVVYSVGFIEHFEDWESILKSHLKLVRPGGLLLLSAPNFVGPLQKGLHRIFDGHNLTRHVLEAMDPRAWAEVARREGFEVREAGWFDGFDFWIGVEKRSFLKRAAFAGFRQLIPVMRRALPKGRAAWAPYCGLAARRPG